MNETLMRIVERTVRPIMAHKGTKLGMRADLYSQLEQIYQEELQRKDATEESALARAQARFGDPDPLRQELQRTVSLAERASSAVDYWLVRRRDGEPLLRFAARIGRHVGAAVFLYGVFISLYALFGFGDHVGIPFWIWLASATILCGLEGFLLVILGHAALETFTWTESSVRLTHKLRFVGISLAAGFSMALAELVQVFSVTGSLLYRDYGEAFGVVLIIGTLLFMLIVWLRAREDIYFRPWSLIELSSSS